MANARNWSLRRRLRLSVLACMAVLVGFLFLFDAVLAGYAQRQASGSHSLLSEQTRGQIQSQFANLEKMVSQCVYSSNVQKLIFTDDPQTYMQAREAALNQLNNSIELSDMIQGYFITRPEGYSVYSHADYLERRRYSSLLLAGEEQESRPRLVANRYADAQHGRQEASELLYIVPFVNIQREADAGRPTAFAVVKLDPVALLQGCVATSPNDTCALVLDGEVLYLIGAGQEELGPYSRQLAEDIHAASETVYVDGETYLQDVYSLADGGWYIAYWLRESELLRPVLQVRNLVLAGILAGMGILALLLELIQYWTLREIRLFDRSIERIFSAPDDPTALPRMAELVPTAQKFGEMVRSANALNEQERRLREDLYAASLAQSQAILTAYRNQITPHFLFNTLETMRAMSRQQGSPQLEGLIRSTSQFLRYTLRSDKVVTLEEELRYIRVYCEILNARFLDRVEMRTRIEPEARSMRLLSTILQPLVENSVSHGMDGATRRIFIRIEGRAERTDGSPSLALTLTDNGCGIAPARLDALLRDLQVDPVSQSTDRIGLRNIYHRLRLHYGDSFSMEIHSREGHYTQVLLHIPQD